MTQHLKWGATLLGIALILCGCKKKAAESQTPTPSAEASAPANPTPAPGPAADAAATAPAQQSAPVINTTEALADVSRAIKAREYQKAAASLIAVQQQPLNPQQAAAVHNQMVQFQGTLAGAVASGDPNAKLAAEQLRASSMH